MQKKMKIKHDQRESHKTRKSGDLAVFLIAFFLIGKSLGQSSSLCSALTQSSVVNFSL